MFRISQKLKKDIALGAALLILSACGNEPQTADNYGGVANQTIYDWKMITSWRSMASSTWQSMAPTASVRMGEPVVSVVHSPVSNRSAPSGQCIGDT